MQRPLLSAVSMVAVLSRGTIARSETITIATVNNADMILRQRVTTDIAAKGSQFDFVTIGAYGTPLRAKHGWLDRLNDSRDYDDPDIVTPVSPGLTVPGQPAWTQNKAQAELYASIRAKAAPMR